MKSERGIYYHTRDSDIILWVGDYLFYFSSQFNKERFIKYLEEYKEKQRSINMVKYKVKIDLELFYSFALYKEIEKRGYKIFHKDKEILNDEEMKVEFKGVII